MQKYSDKSNENSLVQVKAAKMNSSSTIIINTLLLCTVTTRRWTDVSRLKCQVVLSCFSFAMETSQGKEKHVQFKVKQRLKNIAIF